MSSTIFRKIRLPAACLLTWLFVLAASADPMKCDVCGEPIEKGYYTMVDRVTGENKHICKACESLEGRCFLCGLPVRADAEKLSDGRFLCDREAREAVTSDEEAQLICSKVHDDLDRLFSRFLTIPETNVVINMGDRFQLEGLFKAPGYENACVTVFGATLTSPLQRGKFMHHITILSYLRKSHLMAVCAHEYAHTWMNENITHERKVQMSRDSIEGFCELVAYKYMESLHETGEMRTILKNNYTKGQIHVLIAADDKYGFNTVMEWIISGEDNTLDLAKLERVRAVHDDTPPTPPATLSALLVVPAVVPVPAPNCLTLKGISGAPPHRFALINSSTFEVGETRRMRLGGTNATVECLEIHNDSVVIRVSGSAATQQLLLPPDP